MIRNISIEFSNEKKMLEFSGKLNDVEISDELNDVEFTDEFSYVNEFSVLDKMLEILSYPYRKKC